MSNLQVESGKPVDARLQKLERYVNFAVSEERISDVVAAFENDNWRTRSIARSFAGANAFVFCAYTGLVGGVRRLLYLGADSNAADRDGHLPLCAAAVTGRVEVVKELLVQSSVQVNARCSFGCTPLHATAGSVSSKLEIVDMLLKAGARLSAKTRYIGATAAHCAAGAGNVTVLRRLLEAGSNVDAENNDGDSVFAVAVLRGKLEAMKCLLCYKPKIVRSVEDLSALLVSVTLDPVSRTICKILLDLGARTDYMGKNIGQTCLHRAATRRSQRLLELYLREKSTFSAISMMDWDGYTPLALACLYGQHRAAQSLIRHGAPVDGIQEQLSPLLFAVSAQDYEIARRLLMAGAKSCPIDNVRCFPLDMAAHSGNIRLCRLLLEWSDNSGRRDEVVAHQCPMLFAVKRGNIDTAKYLIKSGFDSSASIRAETLLIKVVKNFSSSPPPSNWREVIGFILQLPDADINGHDEGGFTALHEAGFPELAHLLIERGADVEARSKIGQCCS